MSKVAPLTAQQAISSVLNRIAPRIDRARQVAVRVGLHSRRVFLVWEKWTGFERGEGRELEVLRLEILPTPKIIGLDAVALNPFSAGILPVGSIRVEKISATYTEDQLRGLTYPVLHADHINNPYDFFYEVVEDGRGDPQPIRQKYRLAAQPWRREGLIQWQIVLERISEDAKRDGTTRYGSGT